MAQTDSEVLAAASRRLRDEFELITAAQEQLAEDYARGESGRFTLLIPVKRWALALGDACLSFATEKIALYSASDAPDVEVLQTLISALCVHLRLPDEAKLFVDPEQWPEDNRLYDFAFYAAGTSIMFSEEFQPIKSRLPWKEPKGRTFLRLGGPPPETEKIGNKWYLSEQETNKELHGLTECFQKMLLSKLSAASDEALVKARLAFPRIANEVTSTRRKRVKSPAALKRQRVIFGAIQAGLKGLAYCRELDSRKLAVPEQWRETGYQTTYEAAYRRGQPWCKKIQDEKNRHAKMYDELPPAARERIVQGETKGTRSTRL